MKNAIVSMKIKVNSNHNSSNPQPRSIIPSNIVIAKVNGMNLDIVAMIGGIILAGKKMDISVTELSERDLDNHKTDTEIAKDIK